MSSPCRLAFFKAAFKLFEADYYVKADDDIYLRPGIWELVFQIVFLCITVVFKFLLFLFWFRSTCDASCQWKTSFTDIHWLH